MTNCHKVTSLPAFFWKFLNNCHLSDDTHQKDVAWSGQQKYLIEVKWCGYIKFNFLLTC